MLQISQLYIYPIKSLGGISVQQAAVTDRGLEYDRRWMLVDDKGVFLTQRILPAMALLQVEMAGPALKVYPKNDKGNSILIPLEAESGDEMEVIVWDDTCSSLLVSKDADKWFSEMLGLSCHLVYMPDSSLRLVDKGYAHNGEVTSFSDGFPTLIIGQASLDDLNQRLSMQIPIDRFRPNIVFKGGRPFEEDEMHSFTINGIQFAGVKPCARCVITTINQSTGEKGKEPLQALSGYRQVNNKVLFGMNLLHEGEDIIHVGDVITRH